MRGRTARFTAAFQALLLMAMLVVPALAAATEITTDLWVYQDGDTVTVTGVDFGASEVVDFVTTDPEGVVVDTGSASSDELGGVVYAFVLHATIGGIYDVVATGETSGFTAATQFDPANNINTTTTIGLSPSSVGLPNGTTISGTLAWTAGTYNQGEQTKNGRTIHLIRYTNSSCSTGAVAITDVTTSGGGASGTASYTFGYTPSSAGTQFIQASFDGFDLGAGTAKDSYRPSVSNCVQLVVDGPPSVVSTTPASGATGVALNASISVTFSEPVTSSLGGGFLTVNCTVSSLHTAALGGNGTSTLTFITAQPFATNETCNVTVTASVINDVDAIDPPDQMASNFTFSFTTIDAAPSVTSTSPTASATNVALNANVVVNFSESVTAGSAISVSCTTSGSHAGTTTGSPGVAITFNPASDYVTNETCTVTVTANQVTDVDAIDPPDQMASNFTFSFTTIDAAPSVTSTSPTASATNVALNANVVVNFSESVTAGSAISVSCTTSGSHAGTTTGSPGVAITFNPASDYVTNETCTVTVTANQVTDVDAIDPPDQMASNFTFSFSTINAPPTVSATNPTAGATGIAVNSDVTVTFSESVTVGTSPTWLVVNCGSSGTHAGVTTGNPGTAITFNPTSNFVSGETCAAMVQKNQVTDADGANMAANFTFNFTVVVTSSPSTTTVTFEVGPYAYRGTAFTATAVVTGAGGLNESVAVVYSGDCKNVTSLNGCTATATFAGDATHTGSSDSKSITVTKATADCGSIIGYSGAYDTSAHAASGACTGFDALGAATGSSLSLGSSFTDVPGGTAHWTFTGGTNYADQSGDVSIDIGLANAVCTVTPYDETYDGNTHTATGSCVGVGTDGTLSTADLDLSNTTHTNAGLYDADTWTFTDSTGNYNDQGPVTITDNIAKADAVCSIVGYSGTYDAGYHGASGSCTGVDALGAATGSSLDLGSTFKDYPGGTAIWSFTGGTNYNDQSSSVAISIDQADPNCSVTGYDVTYDANPHTATGSCAGVVDEATPLAAIDLSGTTHTNAGSYPADPWSFTDTSGNYLDDSGTVANNIDQADPNCSVTGYDVTYDANPHTATGSCAGVVDEATPLAAIDLSGTTHTNAGSYPADPWSFTDTSGNYLDDSGTVANNIDQAEAVCSVTPYSGTYDAAYHGIGVACTGVDTGGAALGSTITNTDTFKNYPGGTANWSFEGGTNYMDEYGTGSVSIAKAYAVCSIVGYSGTYDAGYHGASGSCTGVDALGAATGSSLDLGSTFKDYPGGTAIWSFTGGTNYNDQSSSVAISIAKRAITIRGNNQTKILGTTFVFSSGAFTISAGTLAGTETITGVTLNSTGAPAAAGIGIYPIVPSAAVFGVGSAGNYAITYSTVGTLTVVYASTGNCLGSPGHAILQPINADGSSVNKQGSTVPAKFRVCDALGQSIGTPGVVTDFSLVGFTGAPSGGVNEDVISTTPDTAFRWSPTDQLWIFNVNTKNLQKNKEYFYRIDLNDGSAIYFSFALK